MDFGRYWIRLRDNFHILRASMKTNLEPVALAELLLVRDLLTRPVAAPQLQLLLLLLLLQQSQVLPVLQRDNRWKLQYCGSGMFIPDTEFFSIPDSNFSHLGSASKNISNLTPKKLFLSSPKYDPGCSCRILIFYPPRIPGSKRHLIPNPGSGTLENCRGEDTRWHFVTGTFVAVRTVSCIQM